MYRTQTPIENFLRSRLLLRKKLSFRPSPYKYLKSSMQPGSFRGNDTRIRTVPQKMQEKLRPIRLSRSDLAGCARQTCEIAHLS